jgi:hypothetical protein
MNANKLCPQGWIEAGSLTTGVDPGCPSFCGCGAATGACALGSIDFYGDTVCGNSLGNIMSNGCATPLGGTKGVRLNQGYMLQGSCTPTQLSVPPKAVPAAKRCVPVQGSDAQCGNGEICVPKGDPDFGKVCRLLPAGSSCPAGWGVVTKVYLGFSDTRACQCACGAPAGGECVNANVSVYSDSGCANAALATLEEGTCNDISMLNVGGVKVKAGAYLGGTCQPDVKEVGEIGLQDERTLCCPP